MTIYNQDGTIFQLTASLNTFNPKDPAHDFFNKIDQELIEISGTPIYYYELFLQFQTIDKLYLEDRGKLWSPVPIELRAYYEPQPSGKVQGMFGIDSPNDELVLLLNRESTMQILGQEPKIGSRIFTPHKREDWVIVSCNGGDYQLWGSTRLEIICVRFQESLTTGEGEVTRRGPGYKIN